MGAFSHYMLEDLCDEDSKRYIIAWHAKRNVAQDTVSKLIASKLC